MNSAAYLTARSALVYWSTGTRKFAPKAEEARSGPWPSQDCGKLRLISRTFQRAVKPCAPTVRSSGRKAPRKLGVGQVESSETLVVLPSGRKFRSWLPLSFSPKENELSSLPSESPLGSGALRPLLRTVPGPTP